MIEFAGIADLHTHTTFSDGMLTPEELVRAAAAAGIATLSITDHDTLDSLPAARKAARMHTIELIPGCEFSAQSAQGEVHILGYFIDPASVHLQNYLSGKKEMRRSRAEDIVKRLVSYGIEVSWDMVLDKAGNGTVGRPHIAAAMVEQGLVDTYQEAFDYWIGDGRPAWVSKKLLAPAELIELIHDSGGVAVLAHPGRDFDRVRMQNLIAMGLDGIEVVHPRHSSAFQEDLREFAQQEKLVATGGSDFHIFRRGAERTLGKYVVDCSVTERMRVLSHQYRRDGRS